MIDQLLKVIQENSQEVIVKNKSIPDQFNQGVQMEIMHSIESGLSSALASGKTSEVMELFGKSAKGQSVSGNPLIQMITRNAVENLSKKFNLPPALVSSIVSSLIPQVLGKFAKQTADPKNPSIDMNQVVGMLLGNKQPQGVNFNELLQKMAGAKSTPAGKAPGKTVAKQPDPVKDILGTLGKFLKR